MEQGASRRQPNPAGFASYLVLLAYDIRALFENAAFIGAVATVGEGSVL
jgi:hypothetical protein